MGCDIHCYMEYRPRGLRHDGQPHSWRDFGKRINPGRNYALFGFLAGVRHEGPPVAEPRGYPGDAGYAAREDHWMWIAHGREPGENECSWEDAQRYAKTYGARLEGEYRPYSSTIYQLGEAPVTQTRGAEFDGLPTMVAHPDWHTHSWVTADEWAEALRRYDVQYKDDREPEYRAMLAALRSLEADGNETRVVFWFDN